MAETNLPAVERWVVVTGFPNYKVSDQGRVARILPNGSTRLLAPWSANKAGHLRVTLYHGGKKVYFWVHRLVAQHYLPAPGEDEKVVCHIDHDPTNNWAINLKWGTYKQNWDEYYERC